MSATQRWASSCDRGRSVRVGIECALDELAVDLLELAACGAHQLRKISERLAKAGWADFLVAQLSDEIRFEYRAREDEYIDFKDASTGQQATALMHVLLNHDGPRL